MCCGGDHNDVDEIEPDHRPRKRDAKETTHLAPERGSVHRERFGNLIATHSVVEASELSFLSKVFGVHEPENESW